MGWNSHPTSGIITTAEANGLDLNLFDNYGQMIARDKTTHATIYVDADARHLKKNNQIYHCLKNSLTASGTAKIIAESTTYHIGSNTCGYLLLNILPQKVIIDTRATDTKTRDNPLNLDTYIATVNSDIDKLNE